MAYTIYEYPNVIDGQPVQPPSVRTGGCTPGYAYPLVGGTEYVAVVSDADIYLRLSLDGAAATSADHKLSAGQSYGFPVSTGSGAKLNATAA